MRSWHLHGFFNEELPVRLEWDARMVPLGELYPHSETTGGWCDAFLGPPPHPLSERARDSMLVRPPEPKNPPPFEQQTAAEVVAAAAKPPAVPIVKAPPKVMKDSDEDSGEDSDEDSEEKDEWDLAEFLSGGVDDQVDPAEAAVEVEYDPVLNTETGGSAC